MVRNGSSSRTHLLPIRPDNSGVAAGNVPAFMSAEDWLMGSVDIKTLDSKLWAVLEDMACRKCHNNLESLRRYFMKAAAEIPLETARAMIAEWLESLKACVRAEGGHFE
jgi:hypothetical protein